MNKRDNFCAQDDEDEGPEKKFAKQRGYLTLVSFG